MNVSKQLPAGDIGYNTEMQQAAKAAAATVNDDFWDEVQRLQNERVEEAPLITKRPTREDS